MIDANQNSSTEGAKIGHIKRLLTCGRFLLAQFYHQICMSPLVRVWGLLGSGMARKGWLVFIFILGGMAMEVFSLALVFPALGILLNPDFQKTNKWIASLFDQLGVQERGQEATAGLLFLVSAYGLKSLYLSYLFYRQNLFVFDFQADLSRRLFAGYMSMPWTFHLQKKTSELVRNIVIESSNMAYLLLQAVQVLAEVFILLGVIGLLCWLQPIGCMAVLMGVLCGSWFFQCLFKSKAVRWGDRRQKAEDLRISHLMQGLGGGKEIRILGRQNWFLQKFDEHNSTVATLNARSGFIQMMPRVVLEFVVVFGLLLFLAISIRMGEKPESLLIVIGVFAAAAFRLLPSASRILVALHNSSYYLPVLGTVERELNSLNRSLPAIERSFSSLRFQSELAVHDLTYSYSGSKKKVLERISFIVPFGKSIAIVGKNGTGKSTLLDLLLGLLEPSSGFILADGVNIQNNLPAWQSKIGYVPQNVFLTDDTILANIAFGISARQIDLLAVKRAVDLAGLEDHLRMLPEGLNTKVGEKGSRLSGGQRQKIGIARALYSSPSLLVFDEPTSALDKSSEKAFAGVLARLRGCKTIIMVTHEKKLASLCDTIIRLKENRASQEIIAHKSKSRISG